MVPQEVGQRLLALGDGKTTRIVPTGLSLVRYHQSTNPRTVQGIKSAVWKKRWLFILCPAPAWTQTSYQDSFAEESQNGLGWKRP